MTTKDKDIASESLQVIDERQLIRIEAMHRGFLYQHLYAVCCLLLAGPAGVRRVIVEGDEDVQIEHPKSVTYVQVKTRKQVLRVDDVDGALERFSGIRDQHKNKKRRGKPRFIIASNAEPDAKLIALRNSESWPDDVELHWPDGPQIKEASIPAPPRNIVDAIHKSDALAAGLQFSLLRPDTLTWKLASIVMLAASGTAPRQDHAFTRVELPDLFEQLVTQSQDLPAPPAVYRPQVDEPSFTSDKSARLIVGLSGAGKTAWVAEAASHSPLPVTYVDVTDMPGAAVASAVAREVAAKMFGRQGSGVLGEVLLPGASGLDSLGALSVKVGEQGLRAPVVIDNAHRVPAADLRTLIARAPNLQFLLLCQPCIETEELQAALAADPEVLGGWNEDTIAAAVTHAGCRCDYATCERLSRLTGGLPFYVLSAAAIAAREYDGSLARLCSDVESQTHVTALAQEIILRRAFENLSDDERRTLAILSVADVVLTASEASQIIEVASGVSAKQAAARLRELPRTGFLELFGGSGLKVHDAVRSLAHSYLARQGDEFENNAKAVMRNAIIASIQRDWSIAKVALLVRLFGQLNDAKVLVQFATDELFHEMGVWPEIEPFLVALANDEARDSEMRFWAFDGLAFNDLRSGHTQEAIHRIDAMRALLERGDLGADEWLAWAMKRMLVLSTTEDVQGASAIMAEIEARLPDSDEHRRIFHYNRAVTFFKLGAFEVAAEATAALIPEYYDVLGIDPQDVILRNPSEIRPLLRQGCDLTDDLKHLADTLELHAMALQRLGRSSPFARIHAMKFYELAHAPQSFIRVAQDHVDEFVGHRDFEGARDVLENAILPTVQRMGLVGSVVPVRAQYAVVLAYCGAHQAAEDEMRRLAAYEEGLFPAARAELRAQRTLVEDLRRLGPPPQRDIRIPPWLQELQSQRRRERSEARITKVGRNERCPCGSGKKYKHCHGR